LDFRLKYPPADTGFQGHQQHTVQTKAGADHHPVDWQ